MLADKSHRRRISGVCQCVNGTGQIINHRVIRPPDGVTTRREGVRQTKRWITCITRARAVVVGHAIPAIGTAPVVGKQWPLRIAISGQQSTPGGAIEIAYLLGKEETLRRVDDGSRRVSEMPDA